MQVLIAFDVDGTISTSNGPVTVARMHELEDQGVTVVIVSPSSLRPRGFLERITGTREDCLRAAAADYPNQLRFYVSDNKDQAVARAAGFSYIGAADFI